MVYRIYLAPFRTNSAGWENPCFPFMHFWHQEQTGKGTFSHFVLFFTHTSTYYISGHKNCLIACPSLVKFNQSDKNFKKFIMKEVFFWPRKRLNLIMKSVLYPALLSLYYIQLYFQYVILKCWPIHNLPYTGPCHTCCKPSQWTCQCLLETLQVWRVC